MWTAASWPRAAGATKLGLDVVSWTLYRVEIDLLEWLSRRCLLRRGLGILVSLVPQSALHDRLETSGAAQSLSRLRRGKFASGNQRRPRHNKRLWSGNLSTGRTNTRVNFSRETKPKDNCPSVFDGHGPQCALTAATPSAPGSAHPLRVWPKAGILEEEQKVGIKGWRHAARRPTKHKSQAYCNNSDARCARSTLQPARPATISAARWKSLLLLTVRLIMVLPWTAPRMTLAQVVMAFRTSFRAKWASTGSRPTEMESHWTTHSALSLSKGQRRGRLALARSLSQGLQASPARARHG